MGFDSGRGFTSAGGSSGGQGEIGGTLPTGTEGQILYFDGTTNLWTATSNVFIDDTNNRVGIGITSSLLAKLHVKSASGITLQVDGSSLASTLKVADDGTVNMQNIEFRYLSSTALYRNLGNGNHFFNSANDVNNIFKIFNTGRVNVGIDVSDDIGELDAQFIVGGIGTSATYGTKSNVSVVYRKSELGADIVGFSYGMKSNNSYIQAIAKSNTTPVNLVFGGYDGVSAQLETLRLTSGGYNVSKIKTSALADGTHENSEMSFWVDEAGNTLNFKVKYSGGTVKSGSVALV